MGGRLSTITTKQPCFCPTRRTAVWNSSALRQLRCDLDTRQM
jgi:hypothetical protein